MLNGLDTRNNELSEIERFIEQRDYTTSLRVLLNSIDEQRIKIDQRYEEALNEITYLQEELKRNKQLDGYDLSFAAFSGVMTGLIDVLFVGQPYSPKKNEIVTSKAQSVCDGFVDKTVTKFAELCGWDGPSKNSDPLKSAISYLERKFKVNYDQTSYGQAGLDLTKLTPSNHHIKSLAHSPSLIGLIFSIVDQFQDTATFLDNGTLLRLSTKNSNFELQGGNFIAKIFCGFCNWFGHLMSDIAGSNGVRAKNGRGMGIPVPFFELFQLMGFGALGKDKQTFSEIAVKVFEKGYDARFGIALAIPVLVNEMMIHLYWYSKQIFYYRHSWKDIQQNKNLDRMLLISSGVMCLVDIADATIRAKGNWIVFFSRLNFVAWSRLSYLGLKELAYNLKANYILEAEEIRSKILGETSLEIQQETRIFLENYIEKTERFFVYQQKIFDRGIDYIEIGLSKNDSAVLTAGFNQINEMLGYEPKSLDKFKAMMKKKNGKYKL
ncbi:hypothetical protein [Moellerella wisconsensis]|uniref:Uncharacterized protein n=1 Tax=Moellerella wisconsensis TaxID=158849 RepID=A0A9Q8Q364_9GAMM|nr:hypothetical protein [Moellerella wisconsensis]UNH31392.1 hypothetical protein MNY72_03470 [Moellerella wisconsensis]